MTSDDADQQRQKEEVKTSAEIFATEVRATRERKGWTQERLAERLVELGSTIDRSTVAKIEAGKRGVSLDECLIFAVALGVSPSTLVFPRSSKVRLKLAELSVSQWGALVWWRGVSPLDEPGTTPSLRPTDRLLAARSNEERGSCGSPFRC